MKLRDTDLWELGMWLLMLPAMAIAGVVGGCIVLLILWLIS